MSSKSRGNSGTNHIISIYKGSTIDYFEDKRGTKYVSVEDMIQLICTVCQTLGKAKLGIARDRIEIHSI